MITKEPEQLDAANYYLETEVRVVPVTHSIMYSPLGNRSWDINSYVVHVFEDLQEAIDKLKQIQTDMHYIA